MQNYVFYIFYLSILIIVINIILPTGRLNKNIKSVFTIIVVFTVIMPLVSSLKNIDDFTFDFENVQYNYLYQVNTLKLDYSKERCIKLLNEKNYICDDIEVSYSFDDYDIKIDKIKVFLNKNELKNDATHKDIIENIKSIVVLCYNVKESDISVYEK